MGRVNVATCNRRRSPRATSIPDDERCSWAHRVPRFSRRPQRCDLDDAGLTSMELPMTGKIVRMRGDKGFCFILGDDGVEYFAHARAFLRSVFDAFCNGDRVVFDVSQGDRGPRAERVRTA